MKKEDIKSLIDHTILKADASIEEIKVLCSEAKEYEFASVCINPSFVPLAKELLKDSKVKVCTVVGFPLGATTSKVKAFETLDAIENGAEEIDMVINIGKLKDRDLDYVRNDIKEVSDACTGKALLKVIIETALLTNEEKEIACKLSLDSGADYVKTSTGFSTTGANVEDVRLMKKSVNGALKVKASGGIKNYNDAVKMIEAGADRLGTSSSIEIVSLSN